MAGPFRRRAHHHLRRAARIDERRADYAGQPPEGSTIHRTGRAQKTTPQVVSELVPTAGERQEAGAGESEAPSTGHFAQEL